MSKTLALAHTSRSQIDVFERLAASRAGELRLRHVVHEEWLFEARGIGVDEELRARARAVLLEEAERADAVLCTCETFGPIADLLDGRIMRVDRPLMERAVEIPATIVVGYCLDSAMDAGLGLLNDCALAVGRTDAPAVIHCKGAWRWFERGDMRAFALEIAERLVRACGVLKDPGCVVLAEAAMAAAEPYLLEMDLPVLTSPPLALDAAIAQMETGRRQVGSRALLRPRKLDAA